MDEAKQLFRNHSIQITSEGQRHLSAALGSPDYRNKYINEKVNGWVKVLEKLFMMVVTQPQATYSMNQHGLSARRMRRRGGCFLTPRSRGSAFFVRGRSPNKYFKQARCEEKYKIKD